MPKSLEENVYNGLIEEVENYGLDADYRLEVEEDDNFHYITLELEDKALDTEETGLDDIVLLGNRLNAKSVAKIEGTDSYKLSVTKY